MEIAITLLTVAVCFVAWQAHLWRQRALAAEAFINNPNVKARDKETEYKDSYEAQVNALDEERRQILVAMTEVFDVLNDIAQSADDPRMMQCRNIMLRAIQICTYREPVHEPNTTQAPTA